jgi:septal ring factor EnvC (AmiA/AmiB activator)
VTCTATEEQIIPLNFHPGPIMEFATETYKALFEKLSDLPIIRQAKKQLADIETSEAKEDRARCLVNLKELRELDQQAQSNLAEVLSLLPTLQKKVDHLRELIAVADNAASVTTRARSHAEQMLVKDYGEGFVLHTLYMIEVSRNKVRSQIEILGDLKPAPISVDGKLLGYREADDEQKSRKSQLEQELNSLNGLYKEAQQLIEVDASPKDIKVTCDALLVRAGYLPMHT